MRAADVYAESSTAFIEGYLKFEQKYGRQQTIKDQTYIGRYEEGVQLTYEMLRDVDSGETIAEFDPDMDGWCIRSLGLLCSEVIIVSVEE